LVNEEAFRENSVGTDVLPSLTADDLKDLGVSAVGDRRRLLKAIAALHPGQESVTSHNIEESLAERILKKSTQQIMPALAENCALRSRWARWRPCSGSKPIRIKFTPLRSCVEGSAAVPEGPFPERAPYLLDRSPNAVLPIPILASLKPRAPTRPGRRCLHIIKRHQNANRPRIARAFILSSMQCLDT
jgi:SAM (Sterile alpha motif) domain-containing protein